MRQWIFGLIWGIAVDQATTNPAKKRTEADWTDPDHKDNVPIPADARIQQTWTSIWVIT